MTPAGTIAGELTPGADAGSRISPQAFAHWPVPIRRVETRDGLTFVHAATPGGFTAADYRRIPDHGRIELLDGVAVVSPPPTPAHRQAAANLGHVLEHACPGGMVFYLGIDVPASRVTVLTPDLQAIPTGRRPRPRPLVVEVLAAHGRAFAYQERPNAYRRARVACYWLLDPDTPSLTVFERTRRGYRQTGSFTGDQECAVDRPFPVRFRLPDLLPRP